MLSIEQQQEFVEPVIPAKTEQMEGKEQTSSGSDAVLRAQELILSALHDADATTLRYLINLRDSIKNLDYERLLAQLIRKEEARRKDHSHGGFRGEQITH